MRARAALCWALMCAAPAGCRNETCEDGAPALLLVIRAADPAVAMQVRSLEIALGIASQRYAKVFELGLGAGEVSIPVLIEPAPSGAFSIDISVSAFAEGGAVVASRSVSGFAAKPNACNRAEVDLLGEGVDAGPELDAEVRDAPAEDADGGVLDAEPDAGFADAEPDAGAPDADAGLEDTGPEDTGPPDMGVDPDSGVHTDAAVEFNYDPSNFDPAAIVAGPYVSFDCGRTTFDTTTLVYDNPCRDVPAYSFVQQPSGPEAIVLASRDLTIASGSQLIITGDRPVIFAVFGNAQIFGVLDVGSDHEVPGAGGSPGVECMGSTGETGTAINSGAGGGGGGFGTAGAGGGGGGDGEARTTGGAEVIGGDDLVPLRGGCAGGNGGRASASAGLAGAGGGALQISASRDLLIPGDIDAGGGGGRGGPRFGGGGGAGSGGAILLEGHIISVPTFGDILANGGGGGEGGPHSGGEDAEDGENGGAPVNPGSGGAGGTGDGGNGGQGGVGGSSANDGADSTNLRGGGGGGGGAVGKIRLNAVLSCAILGRIEPNASSNSAPGCP